MWYNSWVTVNTEVEKEEPMGRFKNRIAAQRKQAAEHNIKQGKKCYFKSKKKEEQYKKGETTWHR